MLDKAIYQPNVAAIQEKARLEKAELEKAKLEGRLVPRFTPQGDMEEKPKLLPSPSQIQVSITST